MHAPTCHITSLLPAASTVVGVFSLTLSPPPVCCRTLIPQSLSMSAAGGATLSSSSLEDAPRACQPPLQALTHHTAAAACPIALIKRRGGWSILLPAHWVMPFWQALIYAGARPMGQQEWRELSCAAVVPVRPAVPVPCFPYDYPHTPAGARHAAAVYEQQVVEAHKRPMGRARKPQAAAAAIDWSRCVCACVCTCTRCVLRFRLPLR